MIETRTIRIQLKTAPEQSRLLLQTMQEYTDCYNDVCQRADAEKISNGLDLHKLTYAQHCASTHLPSQLICAARVKATESIKSVISLRKKQIQLHQKRLKKAEKTGPSSLPKLHRVNFVPFGMMHARSGLIETPAWFPSCMFSRKGKSAIGS